MEHKRKCIACGEFKSKEKLVKITKEYNSGNVVVQPNSKIFGRSAYLCYNQMCIDTAFKKNRINKALKVTAKLEKEDFLSLIYKAKGQLDGQLKS